MLELSISGFRRKESGRQVWENKNKTGADEEAMHEADGRLSKLGCAFPQAIY